VIRAVLFDFDYTLADSSDAIVECFNAGLAGLGLPSAEPAAIRRTIGLSLADSLAAIVGEPWREREPEFRLHWRRRSDEIMVDWTRVYDTTAPATAALAAMGLRLGIVSTKYRHRIAATLARHGLAERFETVVGGEDVQRPKPHPEGLALAMGRLCAEPGQTLYVGDSLVDAKAAAHAGVRFAAVLSGATEHAALAAARPAVVLGSLGELPNWVRTTGLGTIGE
jgi:phosphoglycolate phosphatase